VSLVPCRKTSEPLKEVSRALMTICVHMNDWLSPVAGTFDRAALLAL
jgi:hypothetical protein